MKRQEKTSVEGNRRKKIYNSVIVNLLSVFVVTTGIQQLEFCNYIQNYFSKKVSKWMTNYGAEKKWVDDENGVFLSCYLFSKKITNNKSIYSLIFFGGGRHFWKKKKKPERTLY